MRQDLQTSNYPCSFLVSKYKKLVSLPDEPRKTPLALSKGKNLRKCLRGKMVK